MRNESNTFAFYLQANTERERGNTVQGSPAACPFCVYREGVHRALPLHPGKENGRVEGFKFFLLSSHNSDSCSFKKNEGMRLEISIKNFLLP